MTKYHFSHPRLGLYCACDECVLAKPVRDALALWQIQKMNPHLDPEFIRECFTPNG